VLVLVLVTPVVWMRALGNTWHIAHSHIDMAYQQPHAAQRVPCARKTAPRTQFLFYFTAPRSVVRRTQNAELRYNSGSELGTLALSLHIPPPYPQPTLVSRRFIRAI
jgi:hypothetical protein